MTTYVPRSGEKRNFLLLCCFLAEAVYYLGLVFVTKFFLLGSLESEKMDDTEDESTLETSLISDKK